MTINRLYQSKHHGAFYYSEESPPTRDVIHTPASLTLKISQLCENFTEL